jgi:hypothetical protein
MTLVRCDRMGRGGYRGDPDAGVHVEVDEGRDVLVEVNAQVDANRVRVRGSFPPWLREAGLMQAPGPRRAFLVPEPRVPCEFLITMPACAIPSL